MPSCNPWGNTPIGVWIVGSETGGGSQVAVTNFPETQAVSGSVNATCTGTVSVSGSVAVTGTFWQATQPISGTVSATCSGTVAVSNFPASQAVTGTFFQATQPVSGPLTDAQLRAAPVPISGSLTSASQPSTLCVSQTAAGAAICTATLPLVAGQFHYITSIEITKYGFAAVTGTNTPIVVTSTNLPGSLAWTFARAHAIGTETVRRWEFANPLRSSAAGVASTIVGPATTGVLWRINVTYYAAS